MTLVRVKGKLTESGQIELELPENWQAGDIIIEIPVQQTQIARSEFGTVDISHFAGKTLGEIDKNLIGAGADWEIGDSADWVDEQRKKRTEEQRSKWMD